MKYWEINALQCVPKEGDMINVVQIVNWTRVYEKNEDQLYTVQKQGMQYFESPDEASFTPYDELTFDQVCGWLEAKIDVNELDAQLDQIMHEQLNPKIITPPLPFKEN
jgi:hypothetical protein